MAAAARVHLVEKGKDPRRYAMVGFGGAGPAHAVDVARVLGVKEVIIPPASGAASALGFLAAPLSFESVRSLPVEFSPGFDAARVNAVLDELEAEGRKHLLGRRQPPTSGSSAAPICASSARCTTSASACPAA
jgi:5-oxoprolinase (ATP-hydrolysing)